MPVIDIEDFSGGLNLRDADHKIAPNEAQELINFQIDADGDITKRNGSSKYNSSTIESTKPVHSLYRFYKSATAFKEMLAGVDDGLWKGNDGAGTWSEIGTSSLSVATECSFATWQEKCYIANGTVFKTWDGTTLSDVSGSPPLGTHLTFHKDRLWVAGVAATPNRLFYCDTGDPTTWNTGSNFIDIRSNDGDEITGILTLSDGLAIYKKNSIWVLFGNSNANFVLNQRVHEIGCIPTKSLASHNNVHYFQHRGDVYVFNGNSAEKISGKIDPEMDVIPSAHLDKSRGIIYDNKYWLAYTPLGATKNTQIVVFDLRLAAWVLFDSLNISSFALWDSRDDAGEIYGGDSTDGFVWQLDSGSDDGGSDISTSYISRNFKMGDATLLKQCDYVHLTGGNANLIVDLTTKADHGDMSALVGFNLTGDGLFILGPDANESLLNEDSLGLSSIITIQKAINRLQGRGILLSLRETSSISYSISGMGFEYKPLPREQRYLS